MNYIHIILYIVIGILVLLCFIPLSKVARFFKRLYHYLLPGIRVGSRVEINALSNIDYYCYYGYTGTVIYTRPSTHFPKEKSCFIDLDSDRNEDSAINLRRRFLKKVF